MDLFVTLSVKNIIIHECLLLLTVNNIKPLNSLYYFSIIPQVRTMHARLCSDVAYDYNNLSSSVLVGQVAPLCGTTP